MFEGLLEGLQETGMTVKEIAKAVGISQAHFHRLKNGEINSPSYELGSRIVQLHAKMVVK